MVQFGKEASQMRDYCVAKNAILRAARPDSLGKLGTGSSLRKERLLRMTIKLHHYPLLWTFIWELRPYLYGTRVFTLSWGEMRLTYPIAPGVAATYSMSAASESQVLGIAPCPVKTAFCHRRRNSWGLSPR